MSLLSEKKEIDHSLLNVTLENQNILMIQYRFILFMIALIYFEISKYFTFHFYSRACTFFVCSIYKLSYPRAIVVVSDRAFE